MVKQSIAASLLMLGIYFSLHSSRSDSKSTLTSQEPGVSLTVDNDASRAVAEPDRKISSLDLKKPAALAKPDSNLQEIARKEREELAEFQRNYPQARKVLSRQPMTRELWAAQLQAMRPDIRKAFEKFGKVPENAIVTPDNLPIAESDEIKAASACPALEQMEAAVTVSINKNGQVEDVVNTDSKNTSAIPKELYGCTFAPISKNGAITGALTTLVPQNEFIRAEHIGH